MSGIWNTLSFHVGMKIRVSTWSFLSVVHPLRIPISINKKKILGFNKKILTKLAFPPQQKNWHNRTTVSYTKYVRNTKNYFPPEPKKLTQHHNCQKTDTTAQLEKSSSGPRVASVFVLCLSFCLSVRAKRGIRSKRVFMRTNVKFSFSVRWRNTTIIH